MMLYFLLPAILTVVFVFNGVRMLFRPRRFNERFAAIHERRGRAGLATYARGGMQRLTTRFLGLVFIVAPLALLIAAIWHRIG